MADDAVHQIELQQDKEEWERLHSKHTLSQYVTMGLSVSKCGRNTTVTIKKNEKTLSSQDIR